MSGSHTVPKFLEPEWKALHKLARAARGEQLAGLFLGYMGSTWEQQTSKVLYVGKATAGSFDEVDAHEKGFGKSTAFWSVAREISTAVGFDGAELDNIAWSNIFKIGLSKRNPDEQLQLAQKCLAIRTLQEELSALKPDLLVITAEGWADSDDLIYEVLRTSRGADGFEEKKDDGGTFYTRAARDGLPPVLWIQHPERKLKLRRPAWVAAVQEMLQQA